MKKFDFRIGNYGKNRFILIILIIISIITSTLAYTITADKNNSIKNTRSDELDPNMSTFNATRIFHDSSALSGGIDFGDANNDGATELVVVGWSNRATMLSYNQSSSDWDKILIWEDIRELMDVVITDIDLNSQGNELVVGGYSNNLTMLKWNETTRKWETKILWTSPFHIFGLAAGDIDPDFEGNEIAVVDWKSPTVTIVCYSNNSWFNETLNVVEPLTNVEIGDIDPAHPGAELIAVGANGSVLFIHKENNTWNITTIWQDSIGLFNAEIAEFDGGHEGYELLVVGRSQNATELYPDPAENGNWIDQNLWHAPGGLEGLAIGDFDPFYDGAEIAIGGYSNTATMLGRSSTADKWTSIIMWTEHDPQNTELNGVIVADFYTEHEGNEVAVVGYSGKVTMLVYEEPGFKLSSPTATKSIEPGDYTTFSVYVDPVSDFNHEVELALQNLPLTESLTYDFSQTTILPPDRSVLTVQTEPSTPQNTYIITVVGTYQNGEKITHTLELNLIVGFEIKVSPLSNSISVEKDGINSVSYEIIIEPTNDPEAILLLDLSGQPPNSVVTFEPSSIDPISSSRTSELTLEISQETPTGNYTMFVSAATEDGNISHTTKVYLNVNNPEAPLSDNGSSDDDNEFIMIIGIIVIVTLVIIILFALALKTKTVDKTKPKK